MSVHVIRRRNLIALYTEFANKSLVSAASPNLIGVDKAFAQSIQIANSSWSLYKSGARPIGPRIARQVESILGRERGWLDQPQEEPDASSDDAGLTAFLTVATNFYNTASPRQREMVAEIMTKGMPTIRKRATTPPRV